MIDIQIEQYFDTYSKEFVSKTKKLEPELMAVLVKTFKKNLTQTPTKLL